MNAVLWQPDRALLNAALTVKNTPSIAWAAYRTIFPGTTPFALAVNNVNQARSAFKTFEVRLPERVDEMIETLQSSCRRSEEKRKALADEARKQRGLLEDATSMVTAAVDALSMAEIDDEDFRELLDALDIDPEDPVEKLHAFYATEAKA